MPQLQDVRKDQILTGFALEYKSPNLIGPEIFPDVTVDAESGFYYDFNATLDHLRVEDDRREQFSEAKTVTHGAKLVSYGPLVERALQEKIPEKIIKQAASPYDPRRRATENVVGKLELGREKRLATMLSNGAIVTQNQTLSGTDQYTDGTNSDPLGDADTAIDTIELATGVTPNTAFMPRTVFNVLKRHPKVRAQLLGNASGGNVSEDMLADALGVERIIVAKTVENTAKLGQANSLSRLWGKHLWYAFIERNPSTETFSAGYRLIGSASLLDTGVENWYDRNIKCEIVRATMYYEDKLVSARAIYAYFNAIP